MKTLKKGETGLIALFVAVSLLIPFVPFVVAVVAVGILLYLIKDIGVSKINYYLFLSVVISGFLGPYLAIPGFENLFLFRLLIPLHFLLFLFEKKDFKKMTRMKVPLVLFATWILYSTLSLLWSQSIALSLPAIYYQMESFYLIFMFVYYIDSFPKLKQMMTWILVIYVVTVIIGLWESITGNHLKYSSGNFLSYGDTRATGFLFNTNDYSSYLAFYLPLLLLFLTSKKSIVKMIIATISLGALLFIILETESRSGLVAFVIVVILTCYKIFEQKIIFLSSLILSVLAGIVFFLAKSGGIGMLAYFTGKVASNLERATMYREVLELCKEYNFLGVGIGVTPKFLYTALYGSTNLPSVENQVISAHNLWLSNLADVGIIGILPFILFSLWMVVNAVKLYFQNKSVIAAIPLCIIVAFIAISVGSSSIFEMRIAWIGLGLALTIIHLLQNKKEYFDNEKTISKNVLSINEQGV